MYSGNRISCYGVMRLGSWFDQAIPSSAQVKNELNYKSNPPLRRHFTGRTLSNIFYFTKYNLPGLSSDPPCLVGGWRRPGRNVKSKLQKTAYFTEFKPLNIYRSTCTSCSLPCYFRSDRVDNAFATNATYSVGHLTSTL